MTDTSTLILLITHPNIDPDLISDNLQLEQSLTHKNGEQVVTPKGTKVDSRYGVSKWQYRKDLNTIIDWQKELILLLESLKDHTAFLKKIVSDGGSNIIYITATDLEHINMEIDSDILDMMGSMKISFGFEFF